MALARIPEWTKSFRNESEIVFAISAAIIDIGIETSASSKFSATNVIKLKQQLNKTNLQSPSQSFLGFLYQRWVNESGKAPVKRKKQCKIEGKMAVQHCGSLAYSKCFFVF